jgi:hypothetical protein
MNSWVVAASSKDCRVGSSPSAAARNSEEVLLRPPLLGQLRVDLRPFCLGDFCVAVREAVRSRRRHCATVSYFSMRWQLFDEMLRMSTKWALLQHNAIVLGIILNKCNSG